MADPSLSPAPRRLRLEDRPALVTGGAGGLGGAVADALEARGAPVAILDAAPASGERRLALHCDLADADAVARAVDRAAAELDGLELVVCAAGVVSEAPLDLLEPAEWRRVVDASLTGAFHTLRAAIPHLRANPGPARGSVVALSSGWARKPYPQGAHYAAAKAGLEALVRCAAAELGPHGIRVNAVAPGPVRTPMLDSLPGFDEEDRAGRIPLGRIGELDDVVDPVLFLLGDESRYVTGQVLGVSGGMVM